MINVYRITIQIGIIWSDSNVKILCRNYFFMFGNYILSTTFVVTSEHTEALMVKLDVKCSNTDRSSGFLYKIITLHFCVYLENKLDTQTANKIQDSRLECIRFPCFSFLSDLHEMKWAINMNEKIERNFFSLHWAYVLALFCRNSRELMKHYIHYICCRCTMCVY